MYDSWWCSPVTCKPFVVLTEQETIIGLFRFFFFCTDMHCACLISLDGKNCYIEIGKNINIYANTNVFAYESNTNSKCQISNWILNSQTLTIIFAAGIYISVSLGNMPVLTSAKKTANNQIQNISFNAMALRALCRKNYGVAVGHAAPTVLWPKKHSEPRITNHAGPSRGAKALVN